MATKQSRFVLILLLFMSVFLYQSEGNAQDIPTLRLTLSPQLQQGLEVVYLSDLDIFDQNVAIHFFDLELHNVLQEWENTRLIIRMLQNGVPIATLESDPFILPLPSPTPPPGSPAYSANNIEMVNIKTIPGTDIVLNFRKSVSLPDDEFEKNFLTSGKLERGIYLLQVILENSAWGPEEVKTELRINITNPSLIRLRAPGNETLIQTEFPLFQYESDASNFLVYIYKRINVDDDIETVLSGHPTLEYATSLKQFSYHLTDGDPLEPGATYYWYVKALVYTTGGLEEFTSEVWQFSIDPQGGGGKLDISVLLEELLGNRAEEIAKSLSNYELKTIRVNGNTITLEEFFQLVTTYQEGRFLIKDLEILIAFFDISIPKAFNPLSSPNLSRFPSPVPTSKSFPPTPTFK